MQEIRIKTFQKKKKVKNEKSHEYWLGENLKQYPRSIKYYASKKIKNIKYQSFL